MSVRPNNITRLESRLCGLGFRNDGFGTALDPTASSDGHEYYDDALTMQFGECTVDFLNRYTEKAVELNCSVTADKLPALCKAIADTHASTKHMIRVKATISVTTAVAVCEALRDGVVNDG